MKTPTLFREYIWLVNTIYKARAITLAEINRLWLKTEMSEGIPLSRTTFHRHRNAIEDIFGLIIDCNKKNGNKYYISNGQELQKDSVQNWMLSTLTVSNMLGETQSLHHRILLENVVRNAGSDEEAEHLALPHPGEDRHEEDALVGVSLDGVEERDHVAVLHRVHLCFLHAREDDGVQRVCSEIPQLDRL